MDIEHIRYECPECNSVLLKKNFTINSDGFNVCPICSYKFKFSDKNKLQTSFLNIDSKSIDKMTVQYREIRHAVFNEATKPFKLNSQQHEKNKSIFKK